MYEGDILDLDVIEDLEAVSPILSNKAIKNTAKKLTQKQSIMISKNTIITNPVEATCNKCSGKIVGELISDIYIPHVNKMMPLITYSCTHCGHNGRRSVFALAIPPEQYDRKYFN